MAPCSVLCRASPLPGKLGPVFQLGHKPGTMSVTYVSITPRTVIYLQSDQATSPCERVCQPCVRSGLPSLALFFPSEHLLPFPLCMLTSCWIYSGPLQMVHHSWSLFTMDIIPFFLWTPVALGLEFFNGALLIMPYFAKRVLLEIFLPPLLLLHIVSTLKQWPHLNSQLFFLKV